ncbi:T9SS-dependent choice-of-anchor J family protein [Brumimicrobium mesophilum]|uniref:T9SS-dependent choice-of-anchor J family protein n=1 Tax=Brumimicrobium mesophilum TaxID=392717 RepID=UPI000D1432CD|nr:choice-of-anchor J domain-containing protein [Brumimicrobium mesophilum]
MKCIFTILAVIVGSTLYGQTTILDENFDLPTFPSNFSIIDNDGNTVAQDVQEYTSAWILKEDPMDASNGTVSSTSYFSPVDRADRWLITPQITLSSFGNYLSWSGLSHDPSFPDSYKVMISVTGNTIADFTDTITVVSNEAPIWTSHTELLDDYAGEDVYIAFVNTTFNGFKLYLDSINVRVEDPLSVKTEEINLSVYPNPMMDVINLSTGNAIIQKVEIFNSFGQLVLNEEVVDSKTKHSVIVSNLYSGIYFISVETSEGVVRKKMVK